MENDSIRGNADPVLSPQRQAIGKAAVLLIIWIASSMSLMLVSTLWLSWGTIAFMLLAPFNWVVHSILRIRIMGGKRWKYIISYFICAFVIFAGIAHSDEKWTDWVIEFTKIAAPIYFLILAQFFGNDWIFDRIWNYKLKTDFRAE